MDETRNALIDDMLERAGRIAFARLGQLTTAETIDPAELMQLTHTMFILQERRELAEHRAKQNALIEAFFERIAAALEEK